MQAGTITGAAQILHISQPAVTKVLQHCELQLGMPLFERVRDTRTGGRFIRVSYRTQAPGVLRAGGRAISVVPLVMAGCARPLCPADRVVAAIEARIAPPLRDR